LCCIQDALPAIILPNTWPGLAWVQLRAQLEDLVPVWAVFDYTDAHVLERELILVKVSLDKENGDLPLRMRRYARVVCRPCLYAGVRVHVNPPRRRYFPARDLNRRSLSELTSLFHGKLVDVGVDCIILESVLKPQVRATLASIDSPAGCEGARCF
jgi:acetolactate synthase-1/3 small subunit